MHSLLFVLWFFLPAGLANASPVFASRIKFLRPLYIPIDFGKNIGGKRILGDNKTWLGVAFAVLIGLATIALQKYGYIHSEWLRSISANVNYRQTTTWLLGPLLGFGALLGDAIESFLKRRLDVDPGNSWFPFDQIDYIVGGLVLSLFIVKLSFLDYMLAVPVWLLLHVITSYLGYLFKLKSKPI